MTAAVLPIERAFRIRRMRDYEVDRAGIVRRAILKAVEDGYEFDAPIPAKKRDGEFQKNLRYNGERPLAQYAALLDREQTSRLLARLEASR